MSDPEARMLDSDPEARMMDPEVQMWDPARPPESVWMVEVTSTSNEVGHIWVRAKSAPEAVGQLTTILELVARGGGLWKLELGYPEVEPAY